MYLSALRIHMSENTARLLMQLGGFQLECRGEIMVKVHTFIYEKSVTMAT